MDVLKCMHATLTILEVAADAAAHGEISGAPDHRNRFMFVSIYMYCYSVPVYVFDCFATNNVWVRYNE